jgi:hypothetical protein
MKFEPEQEPHFGISLLNNESTSRSQVSEDRGSALR